jgi:hypothetical protein
MRKAETATGATVNGTVPLLYAYGDFALAIRPEIYLVFRRHLVGIVTAAIAALPLQPAKSN